MQRVTVLKTRNSPFPVLVTDPATNTPYTVEQMAAITRMVLKYIPASGAAAEYADSDEAGFEDVFVWDDEDMAGLSRAIVDVGMVDFTAGQDQSTQVIAYEPDYPGGRRVAVIDLTISEAAIADASLVHPLGVVAYRDITDDAQMLTSDLGGGIRLNAETDKTVTAIEADSTHDGRRVHLINVGAGSFIFAVPEGYFVGSTSHTTLTGSTVLGSVTLSYFHAIRTWVVIGSKGSWEGGN